MSYEACEEAEGGTFNFSQSYVRDLRNRHWEIYLAEYTNFTTSTVVSNSGHRVQFRNIRDLDEIEIARTLVFRKHIGDIGPESCPRKDNRKPIRSLVELLPGKLLPMWTW